MHNMKPLIEVKEKAAKRERGKAERGKAMKLDEQLPYSRITQRE